ncbi:MAG: ferrous iron transport protein A [Marinoscillum sp.]|jgi:ferrous iron transport protein A
MPTLDDLNLNQRMTIKELSPDSLASKLMDMGMYPGKSVQVVFKAPFGGPIAIDLDGYTLSLRKEEASLVEVE